MVYSFRKAAECGVVALSLRRQKACPSLQTQLQIEIWLEVEEISQGHLNQPRHVTGSWNGGGVTIPINLWDL